MPIIGIKPTIDAVKDTTVVRVIRKVCEITDENNTLINDAYDTIVNNTQIANEAISKSNEALTIADEAKVTADGISERVASVETIANDANTTAQTAETNAGNATYVANEAKTTADSLVGRITDVESQVTTIDGKITNAETKINKNTTSIATERNRVDNSIVRGTIETSATDGTLKLIENDGGVKSSSIPIVSETNAGLMNSQTFKDVKNLGLRVGNLETQGNVWYVVFPNDNPTESEIQQLYETANPGKPVQVGYKLVDIQKQMTRVYNGTKWIKPDNVDIPLFTQGNSGLIKGGNPATDGVIIAESDGTGSVQGWNTVKSDISSAKSKGDKNASDINSLKSRVTANETAVGEISGIKTRLTATEGVANSAKTKAENAQSKADEAFTNAGLAQSSASEALGKTTTNANAITNLQKIGVTLSIGKTSPQTITATVNNKTASVQLPAMNDTTYGLILGSKSTKGGIGVNETDGRAKVVGWDDLETKVTSVDDKVKNLDVKLNISGSNLSATVNGKSSSVVLPATGSTIKEFSVTVKTKISTDVLQKYTIEINETIPNNVRTAFLATPHAGGIITYISPNSFSYLSLSSAVFQVGTRFDLLYYE